MNFSEDCPKGILIQYLDGIISKLESILSSKFKELVEKGNKLVLEQIVTTIASVADTTEEKFVAYYDRYGLHQTYPSNEVIMHNVSIFFSGLFLV